VEATEEVQEEDVVAQEVVEEVDQEVEVDLEETDETLQFDYLKPTNRFEQKFEAKLELKRF